MHDYEYDDPIFIAPIPDIEEKTRKALSEGWDPLKNQLDTPRNALQGCVLSEESLMCPEDAVKFCRVLLEHGVDPNACGASYQSYQDKRTPLFLAVQEQNLGVVQVLLKHGADPNISTTSPLEEVELPLIEAVFSGDADMCRALLEKGANPNPVFSVPDSSLKHILAPEPFSSLLFDRVKWDAEDVSPLFMAAQKGHTEVCKVLLEHGADPSAQASLSYYMNYPPKGEDNRQGWKGTPEQAAKNAGHDETARVIAAFTKKKSLEKTLSELSANGPRSNPSAGTSKTLPPPPRRFGLEDKGRSRL